MEAEVEGEERKETEKEDKKQKHGVKLWDGREDEGKEGG
jgi:hypothetical protein